MVVVVDNDHDDGDDDDGNDEVPQGAGHAEHKSQAQYVSPAVRPGERMVMFATLPNIATSLAWGIYQ